MIRKELKPTNPELSNYELNQLVLSEYKARNKEFQSFARTVHHMQNESGYELSGFTITETNTRHQYKPVYELMKPKAPKQAKVLKLRKKDESLLDGLLKLGITDENSFVEFIANDRKVDASRIKDAVLEYISK